MRAYIRISGAVFAAIVLAHVVRLGLDWPAQIAGWVVPSWISLLAILVAGALCVGAFRLGGRAQ